MAVAHHPFRGRLDDALRPRRESIGRLAVLQVQEAATRAKASPQFCKELSLILH